MLRPEEVSGAILHRMKIAAENHLNMPVTGAVISVPACFNGIKRQATKDAGRMAGFNVVSLMNEPTAAMVGYGYQNSVAEVRKTINLLFDQIIQRIQLPRVQNCCSIWAVVLLMSLSSKQRQKLIKSLQRAVNYIWVEKISQSN
jgi:Hsp70 protein